jgi:hypothetical protein
MGFFSSPFALANERISDDTVMEQKKPARICHMRSAALESKPLDLYNPAQILLAREPLMADRGTYSLKHRISELYA